MPVQLQATATDGQGQAIAGVTLRFDPDPGAVRADVTFDATTGLIGLSGAFKVGDVVSGTVRAVTPSGQVSGDADSLRVTAVI